MTCCVCVILSVATMVVICVGNIVLMSCVKKVCDDDRGHGLDTQFGNNCGYKSGNDCLVIILVISVVIIFVICVVTIIIIV